MSSEVVIVLYNKSAITDESCTNHLWTACTIRVRSGQSLEQRLCVLLCSQLVNIDETAESNVRRR